MARKSQSNSQASKSGSSFGMLRYSFRIAVAGGLLVGGLFAYHHTERFLVRDARFILQPPDYGLESPSLTIEGARYASRMQILRVFAPDFGRSINLVPLAQRREQLRLVDWIKDSSVSRIWPNRLIVQVREREPVAFLQLPAGQDQSARPALIDADGVILQQPTKGQFRFPFVTGLSLGEPTASRRDRVHRMMQLMKEIGDLGTHVSEVDVSDRENLKVMARADNRAMQLLLGDRNYAVRLQNFVTHFPEIQRRLPDATVLDMRLEDRITVVEERRH